MNQALYDYITSHRQRDLRVTVLPDLSADYAARGFSPRARMSDRFVRLMDAEVPHILPGQKIVFLRTVGKPYDCFTEAEWEAIRREPGNMTYRAGALDATVAARKAKTLLGRIRRLLHKR